MSFLKGVPNAHAQNRPTSRDPRAAMRSQNGIFHEKADAGCSCDACPKPLRQTAKRREHTTARKKLAVARDGSAGSKPQGRSADLPRGCLAISECLLQTLRWAAKNSSHSTTLHCIRSQNGCVRMSMRGPRRSPASACARISGADWPQQSSTKS